MSKRSELALAVTELKRCGNILIRIAEALEDSGDAANTVTEVAEPSAGVTPEEPPLSLAAVRAVLAEKSCNGHTAAVRALLEKHGATKLSEIDPAEYLALLAEAEVLGNG